MGIIPGLPDSDTVIGNIFLMGAYGYTLLQGANQISDGSELLLEVLDPGLIGGLVLPVLGALPDSFIILMSGLGGSVEEAQSQVAIGMGTLAGSTIMLLTIAWGGSLIVGRCDLEESGGVLVAKDKTLGVSRNKWDMFKTGITTDPETRLGSYAMLLTSLSFLVIQIPAFAGQQHNKTVALVTLVCCVVSLVAYCVYQVVSPKLQSRKIKEARRRKRIFQTVTVVSQMARTNGLALLNASKQVCPKAAEALFRKFDLDGNNELDASELKGLFLALALGSGRLDDEGESEAKSWIAQMDLNKDNVVDLAEFQEVLSRWVKLKTGELAVEKSRSASEYMRRHSINTLNNNLETSISVPLIDELEGECNEEGEDEDEDEEEHSEPLTPIQIYQKSLFKLFLGTLIVALFSDPMVDAVDGFAKATSLPVFFVAFIITPFASNASELVSSLQFAAKKRKKQISLTFSQVYGAVAMNNTLCLAIFMALVAMRGLEWEFSSEVMVTMIAIWAIGLVASRSETFPLFNGWLVLAFYPVSLGIVCFLDYVVGWK
ncbi:hypothetical protein CYMTET_56709 [Cymbomonas tetramitiformis]|uniref:EF-hand domain-containing protein n=1 Tax=Cymbomonas tetramitiformis TaxID=36881 RepID=A0AAE0BAS6_9CHLO|nr:hypothetical protein CYMTET_56709 [Cymbomonas tetramitiformis]|eukprot:gene8615-10224_t